MDLLVANSDTFYGNSISVLLGHGDGTFDPKRDAAVGSGTGPDFVAVGDLNGDGIPGSGRGSIERHLRAGRARERRRHFRPVDGIRGLEHAPYWVALADLNGDGKLDLVTSGSPATLLIGNGDGTFGSRIPLGSGGGVPLIVDLNRDGHPDLAFTGGNAVAVLLGNGNGTFGPVSNFTTGFTAASIAAGDLNGDGVPDLATANDYSSTASVLLGNGDGSFGRGRSYAAGDYPFDVAAGDLDGDVIADLAVTNPKPGNLVLLKGRGDGTFDPGPTLSAGPYPVTVLIHDLDGDGIQDLVVGGNGITVRRGTGNMTYGPSTTFLDTLYCSNVAVGDLNGDGIPDLATVHPGHFFGDPHHQTWVAGTVAYVFFGAGDGSFPSETTYTVGPGPNDLAITDIDGSGHNDLVVAGSSATLSVLLADGSGTLQSAASYPTAHPVLALVVGDFDGDGHPDVAIASSSANELDWMRGRAGGSFEPPQQLGSFQSPEALGAADLDGDGRLDLSLTSDYGNGVTFLRGLGDGTFADREIYGTGAGPQGRFAIQDFNGDGRPDVAVANSRFPHRIDTPESRAEPDHRYRTGSLVPRDRDGRYSESGTFVGPGRHSARDQRPRAA